MIPAVSAATGGGAAGLPYQWVAGGGGGELYTSTSTTAATGTWTSRTSSFGTTPIQRIASNGTSLYVAVGQSGKLATSPDGITWTQRTSSFSAGDTIADVAFGNGYWVAVGDNSRVAYSTDGITWTQKTTGLTGTINQVAWGNGLWVISNSTGSFYTATDPTGTWTSRTSTISSPWDILYWKAQSIWLAAADTGTTGALASSTDGLTWTARTSAFNIFAFGYLNANTTVAALTAQKTDFITVDIESTTDGTSWTDRTPATTGTTVAGKGASDDAGLMVFCYTSALLQTSSNGTTWTNQTCGTGTRTMCHSSGTPSLR